MPADELQPLSPSRKSLLNGSFAGARGLDGGGGGSPAGSPTAGGRGNDPEEDARRSKDARSDEKRFFQRIAVAVLAMGVAALLVLLFRPGSQPAMCRKFVQEVPDSLLLSWGACRMQPARKGHACMPDGGHNTLLNEDQLSQRRAAA